MSIRSGDIAEIKFHLLAHEKGFLLATPLRPANYDFLLDTGTRILRIQIKSTGYLEPTSDCYRLDVRRTGWSGTQRKLTKVKYSTDSVDFIVGYVHSENAWYVIPFSEVRGANLCLYPHRYTPTGKLERFRDAWNLLA